MNIFTGSLKSLSKVLSSGRMSVKDYPVFKMPNPLQIRNSMNQNTIRQFTPDSALAAYMSSDAFKVNSSLRGKEPMTPSNMNLALALDEKLSRLPNYNKDTYRIERFNSKQEFDDFVKQYEKGKTVTRPAFMSTTKDPNTYFDYDSPYRALLLTHGKTGKEVDKFGLGTKEEKEVLFGRNTSFKVNQAEIGTGRNSTTFFGEITEVPY